MTKNQLRAKKRLPRTAERVKRQVKMGLLFKSFRQDKIELGTLSRRIGWKNRHGLSKVERGENPIPLGKLIPFCREYALLSGWITAQALAEMYIREIYPEVLEVHEFLNVKLE